MGRRRLEGKFQKCTFFANYRKFHYFQSLEKDQDGVQRHLLPWHEGQGAAAQELSRGHWEHGHWQVYRWEFMVAIQTLTWHNAGLVTDMEDDECSDQRPLIKTDECTFAYIKHSNLYVVATTRKNSNIAMLFTLLHKICAVMQEYFKEVGYSFFVADLC